MDVAMDRSSCRVAAVLLQSDCVFVAVANNSQWDLTVTERLTESKLAKSLLAH